MSEYVFNAASNLPDRTGAADGLALTVTLIETLVELDTLPDRDNRPLKLPALPWDLAISRDADGTERSLGELANDLYESHETRQLAVYFDALQSHAPAIHALDDATVDAILRIQPTGAADGFEALFPAICDAGFDAMQCVVTGGTLVSLDRDPWRFSHVRFECDGRSADLGHASRPDHVGDLSVADRLEARERMTRQNFATVRRRAFPCLAWGDDVDRQIDTFPAEYLTLAFTRLAALDDIVRRWQNTSSAGPETANLVFHGESDLTMDNYGDQRRFRSSTGEVRTYEQHVWIDRGNRLHFILDSATRTLEVGYLGPHLKTWKF
ncbi:hypothetical protein [Phenylobacterium sp.]|uniref:hypothetical protein n=1 Tax=Phenylobacterium sp. TaxID=1871053 RepID=UPI0027319437|nr:hypothetical protein [Phenylobacterium sp.]MDP1598444.1 hypothetical protein [Phenylobacterium sp.]MDP3591371.1 hypothetical protein [Phenylobacterium sp.]